MLPLHHQRERGSKWKEEAIETERKEDEEERRNGKAKKGGKEVQNECGMK